MPKNTEIIGIIPIKRIMFEETSLRISYDAAALLQQHVSVFSQKIAKKATELSQHSGRTTILRKDVLLANQK